ncbi:hypothetical protein FSARC_12811 [Fusarium sarcochroum]|uniref:C2H2-type domain-containing protein n=1 Tax=Fusarium sarcochroum TaxID=1208366 RepID=A0A8H4WV05_9HYPO|nr:hypothetical protein FSARC_12811 [Fusarium sarcochroum]
MPSGTQPDGTFLCEPCKKAFTTWQAFIKHKGEMRAAGKKNHIHCKFCGKDFHTEAAEERHIHQHHPQTQNLYCSGCGKGPFDRVGGLMFHVQKDCTSLSNSVIETKREEKMEFSQSLQTVTNKPIKSNYGKYMPGAGGASPSSNRDTDSKSNWDIESEASSFVLEKDQFPGLGTPSSVRQKSNNQKNYGWNKGKDTSSAYTQDVDQENKNLNKEKDASSSYGQMTTQKTNHWNKGKNLFPDAPAAQRPTKEQLEQATAPSARAAWDLLSIHNPNHPQFNVGRYYSGYTDKYGCPIAACGKTFKSGTGLLSHLKSEAHSETKYRCPYCLNTFGSLASITQHAESNGVKCRLRDTDTFKAYMDQLTAGMVDVAIDRHDDGTIKYEMAKNFNPKQGQDVPKVNPKASGGNPFKDVDIQW